MYRPAQDDETTGIARYLDQQLEALRASIHGLTEQQAHARPTRSALSIGGLLKHTIYVMRGATARITDGPRLGPLSPEDVASFMGSTELPDDESAAALLPAFDEARAAYLAAIGGLDPDGETMEPSAPWDGIDEPLPIRWRYYLVHQVEELARHAGHADIIREQIDGVTVPTLVSTLAGIPANPYVTPYQAPSGTITA